MRKGRPKGSKNKLKGLPTNFACWYHTLKHAEYVEAFIERGNTKQKKEIKHFLKYCKKTEQEYFEKINGEEMLKRLK